MFKFTSSFGLLPRIQMGGAGEAAEINKAVATIPSAMSDRQRYSSSSGKGASTEHEGITLLTMV